MKRAVSGKGRSGTPPLPRQRKALRVVQLTLVSLAAVAFRLAVQSWETYSSAGGSSRLGAAVFLALAAAGCMSAAFWMGVRTVRGPEPPTL